MTPDADTATSDPAANSERVSKTIQERFDAFPWAIGVLAGIGAFVCGYILLVVYVVVGPASLPGPLGEQLRRVGFLYYNAHNILVIAETPPGKTALPINLLAQATIPLVYRAVPFVTLGLASAGITVFCRPRKTDTVLAVATGIGLALGYLLVALVGTYVFTLTQQGVLFHPDRPPVFLFGVAFPLVIGTVGSVISQTAFVAQTQSTETENPE